MNRPLQSKIELLLVGEDGVWLRILAAELALRGHKISIATDPAGLEAALEASEPDAIVFDHVEPLDVYALNPRKRGFDGPVVLLIKDEVPDSFVQLLVEPVVLKKPLMMQKLLDEIGLVLTELA